APRDLAMRVHDDGPTVRLIDGKPVVARDRRAAIWRIRRVALVEFFARRSSDEPRVAIQLGVHALIDAPTVELRRPAPGLHPTVDAGEHEADDVRAHRSVVILRH